MDAENSVTSALGQFITSEYGLIRLTFSFLPIETLRKCRLVGKQWKKAADATIKYRIEIRTHVFDNNNELPYTNGRGVLSIVICPPGPPSERKYSETADNVLIFAQSDLEQYSTTPAQLFPESIVRFPEWNGVHIRVLSVEQGLRSETEIENMINLPKEVEIKAVVMMTNCAGGANDASNSDAAQRNAATIITTLEKRSKTFAIGGCQLLYFHKEKSGIEELTPGVTCVIFAGPKVKAMSCVLDKNCRTAEEIDGKIEKFSKKILNTDNSVLFHFRSFNREGVILRRDSDLMSLRNLEDKSVKKHLRRAKIVGCVGRATYGSDSFLPQQNFDNVLSTVLLWVGYEH